MTIPVFGPGQGSTFLTWRIAKHESTAFTGGTPTNGHGDQSGTGNPYTIFTVTGIVFIQSLWGVINTTLEDAGDTSTLSIGSAGNVDGLFSALSAGGGAVTFTAGNVWGTGSSNIADEMGRNFSGNTGIISSIIVDGNDIVETIAAEDITAGQIDYHCVWAPAEAGSSLVSA